MQKIKTSLAVMVAIAGVSFVAVPAYAACTNAVDCIEAGVNTTGGTSSKTSVASIIKTVVNVLLFVLGAVAVIMIVIGGIKYTTSGGDANGIKSAKDTILYSVVGLIVAMMAYAIVNFVITNFK